MFSSLLIFAIVILMIMITYMTWKGTYWQRHGIKGPLGLPVVGNMLEYFMARQHYGDVYQNIYKCVKNSYELFKCIECV